DCPGAGRRAGRHQPVRAARRRAGGRGPGRPGSGGPPPGGGRRARRPGRLHGVRRGLAMDTKRDLDLDTARRAFAREPVVRVATIGPDGPHVVPLWFVWEPNAVYCSTRGDARTRDNVRADARVALAFDTGREWPELTGVTLRGRARLLRPKHPDLRGPMSRWFDKY